MEYEIVNLESKLIAGVRARTKNSDPHLVQTIATLWQHFTFEGVHLTIPHQMGDTLYGVYTNYESDETAEYDVIAACEVSAETDMPDGVLTWTIPAGTYARFVVRGQEDDLMFKFWRNLNTLDLKRTFTFDFEVYQAQEDPRSKQIEVYISIETRS